MDIVCDEKHRRSILYSSIKSNRHGVCTLKRQANVERSKWMGYFLNDEKFHQF